jgi:predicted ATP-grasp superfamily ATP-dependent carboligase/protein-tyrosine-phosphatase
MSQSVLAQGRDMRAGDKVLVLGDDTRSFLATVRSLGRQGLEVHVAPFDFTAPSLRSRYIRARHLLPYYLDGGSAWLAAMTALLREQHYALVIPCDERTLLPLCQHREELGQYSVLAIPDPQALDVFFDKHRTRELARAEGVPVAGGRLLTMDDTADGLAAELGLPLVLKNPMSYTWPELYVRTSTRIVATRDELAAWLAEPEHRTRPVLAEQMFPGYGAGVSVLCSRGRVLQAFEHHRAHEVDGSSYYRKSAPLDPARLDAVRRMVAAIGYTGLAMFEFKIDGKSGKWILIEVNARPWGSLPLPVAVGVDFPALLYKLLVRGEESPAVGYRAGVYGRNLMLDLWQTRTTAGGLARTPGALARYLGGWLFGFHRILLGREHHDVAVWDDLKPGLAELGEFLRARFGRLAGRRRSATGLGERFRALREADKPAQVVFVCQGNINRSSYAELRARQLFARSGLTFASAGMLPRNRRSSPGVAIAAAALRGVDMTAHRSRHAFADTLAGADLIVVFDRINQRAIAARYPELAGRVHLLGEAAPGADGDPEIHDPEGRDAETFAATYERIDACLRGLGGSADVSTTEGIPHAASTNA